MRNITITHEASWKDKHKATLSLGDRFGEWVARKIGSTTSVILHTIFFIVLLLSPLTGIWSMNTMLLVFTTIVSIEAIYIGLFLQSSSNRHGDAQDANADEDLQTNREAKTEIEALITRLNDLEEGKIDKILSILEAK